MSETPSPESGRPSGAFPFQPRQSGEQSARFPFAPRRSETRAAMPPGPPPESEESAMPPPPPLPVSAVPPPLPAAPSVPAYRPPSLPPPAATIDDEVADPADKRRSLMLVAALAAVVLVGGGAIAIGAVRSFMKTGGNKKGLLHAAAYAQTRQRLQMVGNASMMYYERHNAWPTVGADLLDYVDDGVLQDKFGNRFVYEGSRITCKGEDGQLGTDDDMWYDAIGFEIGGYTGEQGLENVQMLPPEMRTALKQARMAGEQNRQRMDQIERMALESEEFYAPAEAGMSAIQDSSSNGGTPLEYHTDSNIESGRESDEP